MELFEYKNEIPLNTVNAWREEILATTDITFCGWTGLAREPYRHWAAYPKYVEPFRKIFEALNESFKEGGFNLNPQSIILNLYNHGDSSWLHRDGEDLYTVILFLNDYWDINWGGDFVLVENNEIVHCAAATPGKFLLFKGSILHGARPVSREAPYPRISLVYQCTNTSKI